MLYHYTSFPAMKSILTDAATKGTMSFWATRYDCFADEEEYRLGVETIRRLLPEVEKDIQADRQIASMFDWNEIKENKNLPYPYVVSFTSRPNNEYMWQEYAKEDGVVLEIDDSVVVDVPDAPMLRLASCIYADGNTDDKLIEMLRQEYKEVGYRILSGPQKELAFVWLKEFPQLFVKLIASGLLFVTAPRIKSAKDYRMEEETRAIIPLPVPDYNTLIEGYDETIMKFGLDPTELRTLVGNELTRLRNNGTLTYYRDMHLPINMLRCVYVKSGATKTDVKKFMEELDLNIPVSTQQT